MNLPGVLVPGLKKENSRTAVMYVCYVRFHCPAQTLKHGLTGLPAFLQDFFCLM